MQTLKIWLCDKNWRLTGEGEALPLDGNAGMWDMPANATPVPPLKSKKGHDLYFDAVSSVWYYKRSAKK